MANDLEDELRQALRREQPSAGFAKRVAALAFERRQRRKVIRGWMAIAAMLAAGALVTTEVRDYQVRQREAGEKAGRQLLIALRITGHKLRNTQRLIRAPHTIQRSGDGV
jgi:predicted proteasome-type protease